MLENLLKLVTENADTAIVNNNAIPNENNSAAIQSVTQSIFNGLQDQVKGGNYQELLNLLGGKASTDNNPIVEQLTQGATQNLQQQFGLGGEQAQGIVAQLLPQVLGQLVNKTNDPNDNSFDLSSIIGSLTGGNVPSDLGGLLSGFLGGQQGGGILGTLGKLLG